MRARRFTPERPSALPRRRSWLAACFAATSILLAVTAHGLAPGAKAPPIDGHDLNGKPVSLAALRGKVVIIDFMACWCAPCKAELPRLNDFYLRYRAQGVVVIGVAVDQGLDTVRSLLREVPVAFSVVHDPEHKLVKPYAPSRIPSSFVLDKQGVIRYVPAELTPASLTTLEKEVRELLR